MLKIGDEFRVKNFLRMRGTIPEIQEYNNEVAYTPTFHPELTGNGLLVSYNVDSLNGMNALEQTVHTYQPRFLQVSG